MRNSRLNTAIAVALMLFICSCSKSKSGINDPDETGKPDDNTKTAYIEYAIGTDKPIRVDCSHMVFAADQGDVVKTVLASSASTKASFSIAFPATAEAIGKQAAGNYAIKEYSSWLADDPVFTFSLKAPKTSGATDYFFSLNGSAPTYKNEIIKIEKAGTENGKQVYWISGKYLLAAKNLNGDEAVIAGSYLLKVLVI